MKSLAGEHPAAFALAGADQAPVLHGNGARTPGLGREAWISGGLLESSSQSGGGPGGAGGGGGGTLPESRGFFFGDGAFLPARGTRGLRA